MEHPTSRHGPPVPDVSIPARNKIKAPLPTAQSLALVCPGCKRVEIYSQFTFDRRGSHCKVCGTSLQGVSLIAPQAAGSVRRDLDKRTHWLFFIFCGTLAAVLVGSVFIRDLSNVLLLLVVSVVLAQVVWTARLGRFLGAGLYGSVGMIMFLMTGNLFGFVISSLGMIVVGTCMGLWRKMIVDLTNK